MSAPYWDDDPSSWDTLVYAGAPVPGLAKVEGDLGVRIDKAAAPGLHGARLTVLGYDLASFRSRHQIHESTQWKAWQEWLKEHRPRAGKGSIEAKDIVHPALSPYGVRSAVVERVSFPQSVGVGLKEVVITWYEWEEQHLKTNARKTLKSSAQVPPLTSIPTAETTPDPAETEVDP